MELIIKNGYLITMDRDRRMIRDGAIAIDGNRIVALGKSHEIISNKGAREIDAGGKLVLPGLIDGHNHPVQYLSKGIGDDVHIHRWLYERVYPYEANLTPEDVYCGALGNFVEMIKAGTTCFNDPGGYHVESVIRAVREVGIRGIVSRSTRDIGDPAFPLPPALSESTDEALGRGEDLVREWNGAENDRIRAWFSLRYVYNVSDRLCTEIKRLADSYNVGIHAHLAAQRAETEEVKRRWGVRPVERYHKLGLLGKNLYLVHMGWVNVREIRFLKGSGVKVCHCPAASMHGAYGNISHGMFPKMVDRGLTITLGTDSATAGRFLDMVRIMYLAACAHKDVYTDPQVMGAHKALEMATIDGAKGLLWDDAIGSPEVGKRADLIIIDTGGQEWHPMLDPVSNLIYSASGGSVETVIIDGRIVMEGKRMLTVDEGEVRAGVNDAASRVWGRAGLKIPPRWPVV